MATKKGYKVPEGEEGSVHAVLRVGGFDPTTGEKLFKPYTQKFDPKGWEMFLLNRSGLIIDEVLHLPPGCKSVAASDKEIKAKKDKELARHRKG